MPDCNGPLTTIFNFLNSHLFTFSSEFGTTLSKIFPTSTKTGLNIRESITFIVNNIYEEYSSLLPILRAHESDIEGLAGKLEKDKVQIRDFLNNLEIKRFIEIDRINKTYQVRTGLKHLV